MNSPSATRQNAAPARTAGAALYTVVAIGLIVAMAGLGAAYGVRNWLEASTGQQTSPELSASHIITIGAQRYVMPAELLTDPIQRRDGFAERMDLSLALPLGENGKLSEVAITIMPRGRMRASAALLDSVYLHQFASDQLSGVPGLVGKPLELDAGTNGETVWYDPLSANPFVAKCMTPVTMTTGDRTCLRVLTLSDRNTAVIAFEPAALDNWRSFDARIEEALTPLRK
ncbi:hypothetical protein [Pelagibacterium halotolerans]|uniref:hypothetical protein n=1 Tax=Pelagibacterium halotolerans TaxID=531813 RepID=UPI0011150C74|nr:hypothetical protein [Pelagibacterium halotolerans]QJR18399.1 hypothetical protein HKM20_08110 [Pelagibacterium halotolerans]